MSTESAVTVTKSNKPGEEDEIIFSLKGEPDDENKTHRVRSKAFCECFSEYSSSTSIHGVQYLGEANRPVWERLFWIAVFIISIYTCSHMIHKLWRKWHDTPVIVTFNERETEIWRIPFPAVTICPQIKATKDIFSFEDAVKVPLEKLSESDKTYLRVLLSLCDTGEMFYEKLSRNARKEINVIEIIEKLSPKITLGVFFKGIATQEGLSPIITDEGLCYTFNGIGMNEMFTAKSHIPDIRYGNIEDSVWDREQGYKKNTDPEAYPYRVLGSGMKLGISIILYSRKMDTDKTCMIPPDGYKVLIHAPDNIPQMSSRFFNLPANQHVVAAIKPNMIWTSESLRNYSPKNRQCFFNNERTLTFFKRYTQLNCELECLTFFIYYNCGCVPFYMPRIKEMKICQTLEEIKCFEMNEKYFLFMEAEVEISQKPKVSGKEFCNCLPPCTSISYNTEISQSYYDFQKFAEVTNFSDTIEDPIRSDLSRLTIYFKESTFLSSKRSELYGISEFVANCGGLLGLFMGVSMLSFIEIFYFSTIRVLTNFLRRRNEQEWL